MYSEPSFSMFNTNMALLHSGEIACVPPKFVCVVHLHYEGKYAGFYPKMQILFYPSYSTPLVLGSCILSGFRFTAILIALAKALKIASIL